LGNIGVLLATVKHLNSKSKLVPTVNTVLNSVEFNIEEFFNMTDLMYTIKNINQVSDQIRRDFKGLFEFQYKSECYDMINETTENIN
jgi:hypothetical protein